MLPPPKTIGPLIQAAFIPFAIAARFADILFTVGERIEKVADNFFNLTDQVTEFSAAEVKMAEDVSKTTETIDKNLVEITKLTEGQVAGAKLAQEQLKTDSTFKLPIGCAERNAEGRERGYSNSRHRTVPEHQLCKSSLRSRYGQ